MLLLLLSLLSLLSFMPDIVICTVSSPGMLATGGSFCSCLVLSCLVWSRDSPLLVCLFRAGVYKVVSAAKGGLFDEL